jgi:hypothetical protein
MLSRLAAAALAVLCLGASAAATAGMPVFCERGKQVGAAEQDRVLRFAGAVKQELERSGANVALISRAGLDLSRFGLLYSHAGVALKELDAAWTVRQLYYACDESRPRIFDQGVAGFALGADAPGQGHVSLVFLDDADGAQLEHAARDKRLALSLLAGSYSANAYAFGTRYQNCNQWVAEMLASAWGRVGGKNDSEHEDETAARERAQAWLRDQGYAAGPVKVPSRWLMFAGQFVPLLHVNDHPVDDVYALALRVSVPASIEDFVHHRAPQARRVELCHDTRHIVVRRGWEPIGASCEARPGDEVIPLDA